VHAAAAPGRDFGSESASASASAAIVAASASAVDTACRTLTLLSHHRDGSAGHVAHPSALRFDFSGHAAADAWNHALDFERCRLDGEDVAMAVGGDGGPILGHSENSVATPAPAAAAALYDGGRSSRASQSPTAPQRVLNGCGTAAAMIHDFDGPCVAAGGHSGVISFEGDEPLSLASWDPADLDDFGAEHAPGFATV
jgi:hypothetical protein